MKIIAISSNLPGVSNEQFVPHLKAEALHVWEMMQTNLLREIYFRADESSAVLILECASIGEAQALLDSLPLVKENLITFELIPLVPYPGLARLFAAN
jgi:hypothetical protein